MAYGMQNAYGSFYNGQNGTMNPGYDTRSPTMTMNNSLNSSPRPIQVNNNAIPGRFINQETDIYPNEIPNNGNVMFFPQGDLKRIYAKALGDDGLIHTNVYELVEATSENSTYNAIIERLDNIEKALKRRPYKKPYNNNKKDDRSESNE